MKFLYNGSFIYLLYDCIEADSLPELANTSSGTGSGTSSSSFDITSLNATWVAPIKAGHDRSTDYLYITDGEVVYLQQTDTQDLRQKGVVSPDDKGENLIFYFTQSLAVDSGTQLTESTVWANELSRIYATHSMNKITFTSCEYYSEDEEQWKTGSIDNITFDKFQFL